MSAADYTIRWLVPVDAEQIAALEARVHVSEHRAGNRLIEEQLELTESDGRNLSLGLYHRGQLVGFGLAFVMNDRREMASFFDASLPAELDPSQSVIYIADWVVEPEHRRATKLMAVQFAEIVRQREDLRSLPADAFATAEYADKWCAPNAFFAKLGWIFTGRYAFHDARLKKTLHWLHFNRIDRDQQERPHPSPPPRSGGGGSEIPLPRSPGEGRGGGILETQLIESAEDWDALRPHWHALLERTPEVSPLQTWEYLRTWYAHFGAIEQPWVLLVQRHGKPVALAPWQIATLWQRGRHRRVLTQPAATAEAQISRVLVANDDKHAMSALVEHVLTQAKSWESIELNIHSSQPALAQLLKKRLRRRGFPVRAQQGSLEYHIDVSQARPAEEARPGSWRWAMAPAASLESLERYFDLEHEAPDDEAWSGACASSRHISFYRALVTQHATALGVHIGVLYSGDERAAGIIGFLWRRRFHVVHVTRPERFASEHAEYIALKALIEWCRQHDSCDTIDLTALNDEKWSAWATRVSGSTQLHAHSASLAGWLRHTAGLC